MRKIRLLLLAFTICINSEGQTDPNFSTLLDTPALTLQEWLPVGEGGVYYREENKSTVEKHYLQQFTGQFYSPHLDYYCRILLNEKGELMIRRPTISDKVLEPYGDNRFLFEMDHRTDSWYATINFIKNEKENVQGFDIQHNRMMHHRFEKVKNQ